MPTQYRSFFAANDMIVRYRYRKDGVYEARFHRKGIDVEVSSKDLNKLKDKFIEKLNKKEKLSNPKPTEETYNSTIKTKSFAEYATEWLNVKSVTTKPSTYKEYVRMLEHDILPVFGNRNASEIERNDLQKFLLGYVEKGVLRTAHKLWLVLRCLFDMVAEDNGKPSPMNKVVVPNYEAKKGSAFNYDEEKTLVNHCIANTDKDTASELLVLLYTGLRRSELKTLKIIDGTWLECKTSKERMGKNIVKRQIPFTPAAKKVIPYIDFEKAKNANLNTVATRMKRLFSNHHPHELRHTFITRCKECGVQSEVVSIWAGHSLSGTITTTVYTHYSDEFQLKEAEKVNYR